MKNYRINRCYENVEKCIFDGSGMFQIPSLQPAIIDRCEFVSFNYANSLKSLREKEKKGIHFFIDDYQFIRIWKEPDRYTDLFSKFKCILTPDFSTYIDYPVALQIYNHYRKHWIGAYMQNYGITVIPTISWSDGASFSWCFDGEPKGGTVAVSSIGVGTSKKNKALFLEGYQEMVARICPANIICYGEVPKECKGNIIEVGAFQEKFKEVKISGG